jgi:hypothetical protein
MQKKNSLTTKKVREAHLLGPVTKYLQGLGCEVVVPNLAFFDRGIDLYALKTRPKTTTYAVELKLYKWQKALRQAAIYQLCSDFSYVAVPDRTFHNVDLSLFRTPGIGVLTVQGDGSVSVALEARRSTERRLFYRNAFKSSVLEATRDARY